MDISSNRRVKIIIVDDSEDDHFFAKSALRQFKSIEFISFYSPQKFIDYLVEKDRDHKENDYPDIVILDINMPCLSGFEVYEIVKRLEIANHIRFFILSTVITDWDRKECERLKLEYFVKPFTVKNLGVVIKTMIERTRQSQKVLSK